MCEKTCSRCEVGRRRRSIASLGGLGRHVEADESDGVVPRHDHRALGLGRVHVADQEVTLQLAALAHVQAEHVAALLQDSRVLRRQHLTTAAQSHSLTNTPGFSGEKAQPGASFIG